MSRHPGRQRFAVISPFAAVWLLRQSGMTSQLVRREAEHHRLMGRHGIAVQLESAWIQLRVAADDHRAATSDDGNAEMSPTEVEAESGHDGLTTAEVADMLGLTSTRQVCNLVASEELRGRKVGRSWLVERDSVEALLDVRRSA